MPDFDHSQAVHMEFDYILAVRKVVAVAHKVAAHIMVVGFRKLDLHNLFDYKFVAHMLEYILSLVGYNLQFDLVVKQQ